MKRKKIIALLCVAATSASLVTPVMAEENQATGTTQEAAVDQETPAVETAETEASETEETTVPEEAAPAEDQVPATDAEQKYQKRQQFRLRRKLNHLMKMKK